MLLREIYNFKNSLLVEGGNLVIGNIAANKIDSTKRSQVVPILDKALLAINSAYANAHKGEPIWNDKLLASKKFLAGSSFHFFNRLEISDEIFAGMKKTVGDIDTQVNKNKSDDIRNWLSGLSQGTKFGPASFVGYDDKDPAQVLTLWSFPDIVVIDPKTNQQVPINIQIDLEMKEFEGDEPTTWSQFSTSSSWNDLSAGIKGVFHKFLIQSMSRYSKKDFLLRKLVGRGKARAEQDIPTTDSMYSFAIKSKEGGGLRAKYEPVIDDQGQPIVKDGLPVYRLRDTTGYVTDLNKIFKTILGDRVDDRQLKNLEKKFWSFIGLAEIINEVYSLEEKQSIADSFINSLFGKGAQGLYASNPQQDRDEKTAALNKLLSVLNIKPGLDIEQLKQEYYDSYKVRESLELTEAEAPDYSRKGIQHLYNRLPDGRISSMEMKDADFIALCQEIAKNGGTLDGIQVNLKVDGAGIRFGKDRSGRPFFMTSKITTPLHAEDVGYFTKYGQEKGQSPEQLKRTKAYDDALNLIVNSQFIKTLPNDTIVQAEMMYNPMAEKVDGQLKFVNIPYDVKKLGRQMTLVPFMVKKFSTGAAHPQETKIIDNLVSSGDSNIKIITNKLQQQGIDVSRNIEPVLGLDPKNKKENREILDQARQDLSNAIIENPRLKGKDVLGDNMEGIVVNMPSGRLFKVTSAKMKAAMAAKNQSSQSFGSNDKRTAVVAIGNFAGHKGHEQLINFAIDKAKEVGGTPFVFVGHKVGPDDPIDINTKLETLKKLFPGVTVSVVQNQIDPASSQETAGNIFKKIEYELIKKEPFYNDIVIAVGSDQTGVAKTAEQMQNRYSKFPPLAHVKVSAYVTPRKSEEGGTGVSTTQLRNALKNLPEEEAFKVWSQAYNVQKLGVDWIKHLMSVAKKNMNIQAPGATTESLDESVSVDAAVRSIVATGDSIAKTYGDLKTMAEKWVYNNGTLQGFHRNAAGVGKRWYDTFFWNKMENDLRTLLQKNPKAANKIQDFLNIERDDKGHVSFTVIGRSLPRILNDVGEKMGNDDLKRFGANWFKRQKDYEDFLGRVETEVNDEDDDFAPASKQPKDNVVGRQNAAAEDMVNQILRTIDKKVAGEIRNAIAREPNKLQALQRELAKRNIKVSESLDEDWRKKLAALGMAGMMGVSGAAGAADTAKTEPIIATIVIDGETKRLDLTPKGFTDVRDAEKWIAKFMRERGIVDWQGKIERGEPGSGKYQRVRIMGAGGLESIQEAPIEMDPSDPMDPMIYGHDQANPGKLKYRMSRASRQLQDLAKRAENASAGEWETITRQFQELKMNIEQIRHGLDELKKLRSRGGIKSRGIEKF